jgi:hypothetical protein
VRESPDEGQKDKAKTVGFTVGFHPIAGSDPSSYVTNMTTIPDREGQSVNIKSHQSAMAIFPSDSTAEEVIEELDQAPLGMKKPSIAGQDFATEKQSMANFGMSE